MKGKKRYQIFGLGMGLVPAIVFWACSTKSAEPKAGEMQTIRVKNALLQMVYIPAGEFMMGSETGWVDEKPVHRVQLSRGFWLGRTEVTQELWQAVMGENPAAFRKDGNYPVEGVSWNDCQAFIARLNALEETGFRFRLPTEAEWEYACRAGKTEERPVDLDAVAWYDGNAAGSTHAVGLKKSNGFGLHDMLGNVWEWCADYHDEKYYARSPLRDPIGTVPSIHRVDRGGAWAYGPELARPSRRDGSGPDYRTDLIGFRLAAERPHHQ